MGRTLEGALWGGLAVAVAGACSTSGGAGPSGQPVSKAGSGSVPASPSQTEARGSGAASGSGAAPEPGSGSEPGAASEPGSGSEPDGPAPCPPEAQWPDGMACVRGGTFTLGSSDGRPDEREPGEVYVDTFYMDTHEVTNGEYEACIESGECERPITFPGYMAARQPVVAVSWFDAVAFCEMHGKRLPTEAEWERGASGPDDTVFPWGDRWEGCERAIVETDEGKGCGRGKTWPVGSRPAAAFGLYDMAGNVHEWVRDWYSPCLGGCEDECGDACFGRNPRGPCDGALECEGRRLRSVRGGSWWWPWWTARASDRRGGPPKNLGPHRFGFRCARDLQPSPAEGGGEAEEGKGA